MNDIRRTTLDWARDIARSYRSALHAENPERCAQLDEVARKRGQHWVAPTEIPAHLVEEALDAQLSAVDIAHFWGVPADTIRSWARASRHDPDDPSKPLLQQYPGPKGPLYVPREVLAVAARHRSGGRLREAAGQ